MMNMRMMRRPSGVMMALLVASFFSSTHALSYPETAPRQRGAALFMNYCAGCHALRYMRPAVNYPTSISMPAVDARQWFGRMPPDLSLTARVRGPAWIRMYLNGFYADATRPFGANNTVFPDVAMPNVLAPLRGQPGFEGAVDDVVSFLVYVAEPARSIRYRVGVVVLVFLAVLGVLMYRLNALYWRTTLKCGKILTYTAD